VGPRKRGGPLGAKGGAREKKGGGISQNRRERGSWGRWEKSLLRGLRKGSSIEEGTVLERRKESADIEKGRKDRGCDDRSVQEEMKLGKRGRGEKGLAALHREYSSLHG